jgi:hypothetical protein
MAAEVRDQWLVVVLVVMQLVLRVVGTADVKSRMVYVTASLEGADELASDRDTVKLAERPA